MKRRILPYLFTILILVFWATAPFAAMAQSAVFSDPQSFSPGKLTLAENDGVKIGAMYFILQDDCNLVLYKASGPVWNSGTSTLAKHCSATYQGDGNLVIYDTDNNQPIFSSHAANSVSLTISSQAPYLTFTANSQIVMTCAMPFTALHIQQCIDSVPAGSQIELLPATSPAQTYAIDQPVRITKPIILTTQGQFPANGQSAEKPSCRNLNGNDNSNTPDYNRCANLQAINQLSYNEGAYANPVAGGLPAPGFVGGLLVIDGRQSNNLDSIISNVVIDHLIISGNGPNRSPSNACMQNNSLLCANVIMINCDSCLIRQSVSQWAPGHLNGEPNSGGTSWANMIVNSDKFTFYGNLIYHSGGLSYDPNGVVYWQNAQGASNGFQYSSTTRDLKNLTIGWNNFFDGTDGNLTISARVGTNITGEIFHNQMYQMDNMMSGAMLAIFPDIFGSTTTAGLGEGWYPDASRTLWVHDNAIDCDFNHTGIKHCPMGISLGIEPWGNSKNPTQNFAAYKIAGGRIENNQIYNARVGINIDGVSQDGWGNLYLLTNYLADSNGIKINKSPDTLNSLHTNCRFDNGLQSGSIEWTSDNTLPACALFTESQWAQIDTSYDGCEFGSVYCVGRGFPPPIAHP